MNDFIKNRMASKSFWVSFAALIPMVLQLFGLDILPKEYSSVTNMILTLLVTMGVLNNPTTENNWYLDDKNQAVSDPADKVE